MARRRPTDTTPLVDGIPHAAAEAAVQWLMQLRANPGAEALIRQWQQWRAAHPDHERAWQRIEQVNATLAPLRSPQEAALAATALTATGARRRRALGLLTLLFFTGGGAALTTQTTAWRHWRAELRTATGEQRRTRLADGTEVLLNTASVVALDYSAQARELHLLAGEIQVRSAPDPAQRPLRVVTPQGQAQALGTDFLVRLQDDSTVVAVFDGAVALQPQATPAQTLVLAAGEQADFTRTHLGPRQPLRPHLGAWRDGVLVADDIPLATLLDDLNRYRHQPLRYAPAVAGWRVSGTYPVTDSEGALQALTRLLPLQVRRVPARFWGEDTLWLEPSNGGLAPAR